MRNIDRNVQFICIFVNYWFENKVVWIGCGGKILVDHNKRTLSVNIVRTGKQQYRILVTITMKRFKLKSARLFTLAMPHSMLQMQNTFIKQQMYAKLFQHNILSMNERSRSCIWVLYLLSDIISKSHQWANEVIIAQQLRSYLCYCLMYYILILHFGQHFEQIVKNAFDIADKEHYSFF